MLVKNWMSKNIITADVAGSMRDAVDLMKQNDIRMLPVLKNERLVGIITDRDLKRAAASDATSLDAHELIYLVSRIKIRDIMTENPITVLQDYTVEETAEVLLKNKISGAPVLDQNGALVGTITQTDLFRVLMSLTGVGNRGIQIAFQLEDRPGSIKEIADIIRKYSGRMVSILSSYTDVPEGYRKVYIRMRSIERPKLQKLKEEFSRTAALIYLVDHRDNSREIF